MLTSAPAGTCLPRPFRKLGIHRKGGEGQRLPLARNTLAPLGTQWIEEDRRAAQAAVPDRQLALGERHDQEDHSVKVQRGTWHDETKELEGLGDRFAKFQARQGPPGVANRLRGDETPNRG